MGWVYFQMGDYEKALQYIQRSIEISESSAEVLEHLGDVYEKLGQMELAIQYWEKAKKLEPDRESVLKKLELANHK
jgi:tetratricopeptide (TPR) repeat protein